MTTIIRHLSPEFKEELKADRINLSTAYELAGLPEEDQRAAFEEYQRAGEISIKAARERKPQTAPPPPPPQAEQPPEELEETAPPAEPVRERDEHTPPAAHCIPSAVPPPKIEWDKEPGAEHPTDGPQNAQDGQKPQAVKMDPEGPKSPQRTRRGERGRKDSRRKKRGASGKGFARVAVRSSTRGRSRDITHSGRRPSVPCIVRIAGRC